MPAHRQDPPESFDDELPSEDRLDVDEADEAPLDSEIDFDDEADSDQSPLDEVEARELGVNLDDPEELDEDDEI